MSNDAIPFYFPGDEVTGKATAAVTGKRFVKVSGNGAGNVAVAHADAGAAAFGVAGYDAAVDETLPVLRAGIVPVTAAAALTAGQGVEVGASGQAAAHSAGVRVGTVVFDAAAGADAAVALD